MLGSHAGSLRVFSTVHILLSFVFKLAKEQFNLVQRSFIGMRKRMFILPKQVSKYNKNRLKEVNVYIRLERGYSIVLTVVKYIQGIKLFETSSSNLLQWLWDKKHNISSKQFQVVYIRASGTAHNLICS